jgi:hypothetical protein
MIAIALIACWLGWELYVVRTRATVRRELQTGSIVSFTTVEQAKQQLRVGFIPPRSTMRDPSWLRRAMGDEAIETIYVYKNLSSDYQALGRKAQWWFPDAEVTYVEQLMEPCHPGCFPWGTPVETPTGARPIETIEVGDEVTSVRRDGTTEALRVKSIFRTQNCLWAVETESDVLTTTETQPLRLADGTTKAPGELLPGDVIERFVDGRRASTIVRAVKKTSRVADVINLVLGDRQTFVADGFVVRSKPPHAETRGTVINGTQDDQCEGK